jgi:hypothetical protein
MKVGDLVIYVCEDGQKVIGLVVLEGKTSARVQFVDEPHKQVWVSAEYLEVIGS